MFGYTEAKKRQITVTRFVGSSNSDNHLCSNKRAECYIKLRKALESGVLKFRNSPEMKELFNGPNGIRTQLLSQRIKSDDGKLSIVAKADIKKFLKRSPDIADTISMLLATRWSGNK